MRKPTMSVWNRSDTNQTVQAQLVSDWKFWILKVEELYYQCSENKGADQLRSYGSAPLFSHMQIVGFLMTQLKFLHRSNLQVYFDTSRSGKSISRVIMKDLMDTTKLELR